MDFQFSLDSIFPQDLMLIGRDLNPKVVDGSLNSSTSSDYYRKNFCKLDPSGRMALGEVLDRMGAASARAQGLSQVITTMEKLRTSENHIVYIITRKHPDRTLEGADICVGFLKVGRKRLFILDSSGGQNEVLPVSVLDFYVHESLQRHGYGRQLFDAMLQTEQVEPAHLAIDRPSDKLTSFLAKHYGLRQPCPQMNNFVVYPGFFSDREGDPLFRVRPSPLLSSWPAAGRRSCRSSLEPSPVSYSPAPRSYIRGGRRRLVTARPPPADPRLTRAAGRGGAAPQPAPSLPDVGTPVRSVVGSCVLEPNYVVPSRNRNHTFSQTEKEIPAHATQEADAAPGPGVKLPVLSPHRRIDQSRTPNAFLPFSPKTSAIARHYPPPTTSPHQKALPKLNGMLSVEKLPTPSSQWPGTWAKWDGRGNDADIPSSYPPTGRRRPPARLPAFGSPVLPASGPPARPACGAMAAPPASAEPVPASYPYPWLVSKDELFYPNKRRSPLKNGYEVTSMVGVNGSAAYSRHSHGDSASGPCRPGAREVRNLHDHHQLW